MVWAMILPFPKREPLQGWRFIFGDLKRDYETGKYEGDPSRMHFLDWRWSGNAPLRMLIHYAEVPPKRSNEPRNTFITSISALDVAEAEESDDEQIRSLLDHSRFHLDPATFSTPEVRRRAADIAARIALHSTKYTRDIIQKPGQTQRGLLFIPVTVGKVVLGGACFFSNKLIPDPVCSTLVLAAHTLLYRIRMLEMHLRLTKENQNHLVWLAEHQR